MRRREALVIGTAVAAALALPPILRRLPEHFEFEPLSDVSGFRRLTGGAVSGGVDPFFGIGERLPAPDDGPELGSFSPCEALFGTKVWDAKRLPVAIFSDFNCPYCKTLESELVARRDDGAPLRLVWHEMPLLGDGSYRAAKAVLAARFLGAEDAGRSYLWQSHLPPGPVGLRRMSQALGFDAESFAREYNSRRVNGALADSLALGRRMGVYGTPATVFGRTLVIGAIRPVDIDRLIALELQEGPIAC